MGRLLIQEQQTYGQNILLKMLIYVPLGLGQMFAECRPQTKKGAPELRIYNVQAGQMEKTEREREGETLYAL